MYRYKYGLTFREQLNELDLELYCARTKRSTEQQGLGAFGHRRKAINLLYPKLKWNPWLEWQTESLSNHTVNVWTGCGTSGKTYAAGLFGMEWWLELPLESAVIMTSTTGKMIRKRIWPVIRQLYYAVPGLPGNFVDSQTAYQAERGDDKHGIFALPVRDGNTSKAVANIQGFHPKRLLLVIDEATDTPEAVFEVIPNLRKACEEFRVVIIGNPVSRLDPHGLACEPADGWDSVNVDTDEYETRGVDKWELEPGVCLHFDGEKSPNVLEGENKYPHIIKIEDVERAKKSSGGSESPAFWKYTKGWWPPEGICTTVMSEQLIMRHDGTGRLEFSSYSHPIAALDASAGGDRCVLRLARYGDIGQDRFGVQIERAIEIKLNVRSLEPISYQIAHQVIAALKANNVKPEHFAMDVSGSDGGVPDIIGREWDNSFLRVQFGGKASQLPCSQEDSSLCCDTYDRRVTELWWAARNFLISGQLKGFCTDDIMEFSNRSYEEKGRVKRLEEKKIMKSRVGKSPDYADTVAILVELARSLGAVAGTAENNPVTAWKEQAEKAQQVYHDVSYERDEVSEEYYNEEVA